MRTDTETKGDAMPTTFTYIGCRNSVGYQHRSTLYYTHETPKQGRMHALNRSGRGFVAVCGTTVSAECSDHRCDENNPVQVATESTWKVTCKACLRRNPVATERAKKVVYLAKYTRDGVDDCYSSHDTRVQAEQMVQAILTSGLTFGQKVEKAWVEESTKYVR